MFLQEKDEIFGSSGTECTTKEYAARRTEQIFWGNNLGSGASKVD